eukprot:scaffold16.g6.t1
MSHLPQLLRPLFGLLLVLFATEAAPDAQVQALLKFKASVQDPSGALRSWQGNSGVCAWHGISCAGGRVVGLDLPRAGLRGTLPAELADLPSLQHINLAGNGFAGTLPGRWEMLGSLERIKLDSNKLTGSLPPTWSSLTSLRSLNLANNQLGVSLPVEWGGLSQLLQLSLGHNKLTGTLPASWGELDLLVQLGLAGNRLSGSLPPAWGRMRSLLQADVSANGLDGTLPPTWGALSQLTSLDASRNELVGQLPPAWGTLSSLQVLSLRGNQLSGSLPSTWNSLGARIYRADLAGNAALCGDALDALARACGPQQRTGTALGTRCAWQPDADVLLRLKARVASDPKRLLDSWQPESNPCGLPGWKGISCTDGHVTGVDLAGGNLTGVPLEALADLPRLESIQLSGNAAAPRGLPASWARLAALQVVSVSYAGLEGTLPEAWGNLRALQELNLQGNALRGPLPKWDGMQSLRFLNLGHNSFNGSLPVAWAGLSGLQEAVLAHNRLSGPIPSPWTELLSLSVLDLQGNTAICGGQPRWTAGVEARVGNTNIKQSCLAAYASSTVVGVVVGVTVGSSIACTLAITGLAVYIRLQRRRLHLLQRERSAATLLPSPPQLGRKQPGGVEIVADGRANSRTKLLVQLPLSSEQEFYIKVGWVV